MKNRSPTTPSELDAVWRAMEEVMDPEIPTVSVVDLGMIADIREEAGTTVIAVTPTFAGCPALDIIREEVERAAQSVVGERVRVETVYEPPWTTERITAEGRRKLKTFGLAPPGRRCGQTELPVLERIPCPHCDSPDTVLESIFGPTLCRSIHYCRRCLQSFEHFKEV